MTYTRSKSQGRNSTLSLRLSWFKKWITTPGPFHSTPSLFFFFAELLHPVKKRCMSSLKIWKAKALLHSARRQ